MGSGGGSCVSVVLRPDGTINVMHTSDIKGEVKDALQPLIRYMEKLSLEKRPENQRKIQIKNCHLVQITKK